MDTPSPVAAEDCEDCEVDDVKNDGDTVTLESGEVLPQEELRASDPTPIVSDDVKFDVVYHDALTEKIKDGINCMDFLEWRNNEAPVP